MKKIIKFGIIAILSISFCSCKNPQLDKLSIKFEESSEKLPAADELDKKIAGIFSNMGIKDYELIQSGNYTHVFSDSFDIVYKAQDDLLVASAVYSNFSAGNLDEGWYIRSIRDGVSQKCFYLGEKDEREYDLYDYKTGELIGEGKTQEEKDKELAETISSVVNNKDLAIKNTVDSLVTSYANTEVTNVSVNDDAGTGSGYIVLVNLTWNVKNSAETAQKVLRTYSDDISATIADKYDDVNEIAVMWDTPNQGGTGSKLSYKCKEGKAYLQDSIFGFQ